MAAAPPDRIDLGWCSVASPQGLVLVQATATPGMPGGSALFAPPSPHLPRKALFTETIRDRDPDAFPESLSLYAGPPALPGPPETQLRATLDALRRTLGPLAVERLGACGVGDAPGAAAHFLYHAGFAVALLSVAWDMPDMRCVATMHAPARRGAQRLDDMLRLAASLRPGAARP
ncbi:MAG: hypothetical protein AB7E47_09080 [Desulfovibrionaceae bacterium]